MDFFVSSGIYSFIANLAIGIFVFSQNPKRSTNILFALFSLTVSGWSVGSFLENVIPDKGIALWALRCNYLFGVWLPAVYVHFVYALMGERSRWQQLKLKCGYVASTLLSIIVFTPWFIPRLRTISTIGFYITDPGPLYYVFFGFFAMGMTEVLYHNFIGIWRNIGRRRTQFVYMGIANAIAVFGGFEYFSRVFGFFKSPPLDDYILVVYFLVVAYAIARYHLMDIRVVLTRTTIFVLLYGIVIGLPVSLAVWGGTWLSNRFGIRWWLIPSALYAILSTVGPFLYLVLQRKAEEGLLREQRRYQQTLLQASGGMTLIKDLDRLLSLTVHLLTRTIGMTHASIYLYNKEHHLYECRAKRGRTFLSSTGNFEDRSALVQELRNKRQPVVAEELLFKGAHDRGSSLNAVRSEMERLKAAVVIPSFVGDALLGFLAFGDKKSGETYTQDDLNTLSTLANQAALAVENCNFIDQVKITEAQLFQAAKMADLGTMASGMSHQISNRLHVITLRADAGIRGSLTKIRDAVANGRVEEILPVCHHLEETLHTISDSAKRGGEIVERVLDFSRLSEGFGPVAISEALEQCVRLWECKRDLTEFHFEREISPNLPLIRGSFSQIEEILFNLLDNAFDAIRLKEEARASGKLPGPEGTESKTVKVTAREVERGGENYVEVEVRDTGIGMTPETLRKLFVPFFTTKGGSVKGTGLGLYVVKQMVQAHRGEIALDSRYGTGTTFRVRFPLHEEKPL